MPPSNAAPRATPDAVAPAAAGGTYPRWAALNPLTPVRRRFQRWWQSRLPVSDTLVLTQRNVYIVPTGAGWMLAVTLLVLLVASINYQLNLGYLLTFLLAGSALVGMHLSHATLRGLRLHLQPPEPCFAGSSATLQVELTNERRTPRHGIAVATRGHAGPAWTWTDVPAQGQARVQIGFATHRRGLHALPAIVCETRFPLGTFRVWAYWLPASKVLVYPAPESPVPPLPPGEPRSGGTGQATTRGVGEFDGVRAYRRGDPLKLVVWKKAAQALAGGTDALVSRDAQAVSRLELWLDPALAGLPEREARLARVTAWVLQAERQGLRYGLRLPGTEIAPDTGPAHQRRCLEALALC